MDKLNEISYAYRYRNLDSTSAYASRAFSISDSIGYSSGKAQALNQLSFVEISQMHYDRAKELLADIAESTDNQIELLIADVQMMRICQRQSHNREFYDCREKAERRIKRILEELDNLSDSERRRFRYALSEYHIVSSVYYYYVALTKPSVREMQSVHEDELKTDTAQYLNYLYNMGSGGMVSGTAQEVSQREFEYLMRCYLLASRNGYKYFEANSLEGLAELLSSPDKGSQLIHNNPSAVTLLSENGAEGLHLPLNLAQRSLHLFYEYGDIYQIAGAYRSLATCYMEANDYEAALFCLEKALSDNRIEQAPDLVASIHENLCVVYSAMNDKVASDESRNRYLDMQEYTRQDKYLESRAGMLETMNHQLTWMIIAVLAAIVILSFFLWLFNRLYHNDSGDKAMRKLLVPLEDWQKNREKQRKEYEEKQEEIAEKRELLAVQIHDSQRHNIELRAKLSMVAGIMPLIDRMNSEIEKLENRREEEASRRSRMTYVRELTDNIIASNTLLTEWIQLRQGKLSIRMESFPLQDVFDVVQKSRMSFQLKGITLQIDPTKAWVKADKTLTLFMVNTLADNARKFTDSNGQVTISALETDGYVEVSVSDTGKGIPADELSHIFDHKVSEGHGFGLLNCRGIIEKYKKTSPRFSQCLLAAESTEGKGSRFYFRLPRGVAFVATLTMAVLTSLLMIPAKSTGAEAFHHQSLLLKAKEFADSAYFSNVNGHYAQTLSYADSCRKYLNKHYLLHHPGGKCMMRNFESSPGLAPEVKWYRDSLPTHYQVILDIRNESAVAALALHKWKLYHYNNQIYTRLFKEMSTDDSLTDYCDTMIRQQSNKNIAIILLSIVLASVLPAYYFLYYRHRLYFRYCMERIRKFNENLMDDDISSQRKLAEAQKMAQSDFPPQLMAIVHRIIAALKKDTQREEDQQSAMERSEEEINRASFENDNLHVSNAIMENCLSALKHETMYYPSKIKLLVGDESRSLEEVDVHMVKELVDYYRDIYSHLSIQALSLTDRVAYPMSHVRFLGVEVLGNVDLLDLMASTLRQALKTKTLTTDVKTTGRYVTISILTPWTSVSPDDLQKLFTPQSVDSIPFLICRQIVREISERTNCRGCGISARVEGMASWIDVVLPVAVRGAGHEGH